MTKPNFKEMSNPELKAYVRSHHEDDEAIRELFSRSDGKRTVIPMPKSVEQIMEFLKS